MSRYTIDDIEYISVTEVTGLLDKSSALMPWAVNNACTYIKDNACFHSDMDDLLELAKKEYKNVSNEACDIGSEVHKKIELYIKYGKDACGKMRPEVENAFLAFLEWESKNVIEWLESENVIVDEENCFAGTLDAIARLKDDNIYCIDFKSSKGFYDGYDMQVAAYTKARNSMSGKYKIKTLESSYEKEYSKIDIKHCGVLRLDKLTGEPEFKDYTKTLDQKAKAFNYLLDFYYMYKKRRLKHNKRVLKLREIC